MTAIFEPSKAVRHKLFPKLQAIKLELPLLTRDSNHQINRAVRGQTHLLR